MELAPVVAQGLPHGGSLLTPDQDLLFCQKPAQVLPQHPSDLTGAARNEWLATAASAAMVLARLSDNSIPADARPYLPIYKASLFWPAPEERSQQVVPKPPPAPPG